MSGHTRDLQARGSLVMGLPSSERADLLPGPLVPPKLRLIKSLFGVGQSSLGYGQPSG